MSRMTRPKDNWDCRIRECRAEEWIKRLAEYEDLVEKMKREGEVTLDDFRELDGKFD